MIARILFYGKNWKAGFEFFFFFFLRLRKIDSRFFGEFDIIGYREENDKVSVAIVRKYCK